LLFCSGWPNTASQVIWWAIIFFVAPSGRRRLSQRQGAVPAGRTRLRDRALLDHWHPARRSLRTAALRTHRRRGVLSRLLFIGYAAAPRDDCSRHHSGHLGSRRRTAAASVAERTLPGLPGVHAGPISPFVCLSTNTSPKLRNVHIHAEISVVVGAR
jgi:hypothetical protein